MMTCADIPTTPTRHGLPGRTAPLSADLASCSVIRLPKTPDAVPYYVHIPATVRPGARPLVAVHGIARNAAEQLAAFAPLGERTGRPVIAPLFTKRPGRHYQKAVTKRFAADRALIATLEDAAADAPIAVDRIDLFGFSGGAQFSHRFAMLHPERVGRLAVASAGWYTMPTPHLPFPYGMAPAGQRTQCLTDTVRAFLQTPMLVLVGERDTRRDPGLRKEAVLDDNQGLTRVERAARWAGAVRMAADRLGVRADVRFELVPRCSHSFKDCAEKAGMAKRVVDWLDGKI